MCEHQPCAGSTGPAQGGRPSLELADVVRKYRAAYEQQYTLTATQRAVLDAVEHCRTAALGGHVPVCLDCGYVGDPEYNSCLMGSLCLWGVAHREWPGPQGFSGFLLYIRSHP
jgi:hypothetical protein